MNRHLPSTHESMLMQVITQDDDHRRRGWEDFFLHYREGLAAILARRFRRSVDDADSIVIDFIQDKIIQGNLVDNYLNKPATDRKSFRGYVARSLVHYALRRLQSGQISNLAKDAVARANEVEEDIETVLSIDWFRQLVQRVLRITRAHYLDIGKELHWNIFAKLRIEPMLCQMERPTYDGIGQEFGLDAGQVADRVARVTVYLHTVWKRVLREDYVEREAEAIDLDVKSVEKALARLMVSPELLTALPEAATGESNDVTQADSQQLMDLFALVTDQQHGLTDAELGILFHHFLSTPIQLIFRRAKWKLPATRDVQLPPNDLADTFADLTGASTPTVAVVLELKNCFSELARKNSAMIPRRVAFALRFLAIGLLIARYPDEPIESFSSMKPDALVEGFRHVLENKWLDAASRKVLEEAMKKPRI